MKQYKLKTKITFGAVVICLFLVTGLTFSVAYFINEQNTFTANHDLRKSFKVINDDIAGRQAKLLGDTQQLADSQDMSSNLKYIVDSKAKTDLLSVRDTYRDLSAALYTIEGPPISGK